MARLLIASSNEIFVAGLRSLLGDAGHDVLSTSHGTDGLLAMARSLEPEIIILAQRSCLAATLAEMISRLQRIPKAPKVVLLLERPADASEIAALYVDGIVVSSPQVRQLIECIESVADGRRWVDPNILSLVFVPQKASQDLLTLRERQIVDGVVRGLRNKEIAREMDLREGTIKMRLHNIFEKLKLRSRTQLALAFTSLEKLGGRGSQPHTSISAGLLDTQTIAASPAHGGRLRHQSITRDKSPHFPAPAARGSLLPLS